MKKITFLLICILLIFSTKSALVFASENYARITLIGANLYKSNTLENSIQNVYFEIENTYFVTIIHEEENCYRVSYNGINGYITKNAVKRISGTPQNPYPTNIKLTVNQNCYVRSTPTQNSYNNSITLLTKNTEVEFVGIAHGTNIVDFGDNTWYYIKYGDVYGYVFQDYFKSHVTIYPNTEEVSVTITQEQMLNPLNDTKIAILVLIMLIPSLIIIFLIYHKPKIKHKNKVKLRQKEWL